MRTLKDLLPKRKFAPTQRKAILLDEKTIFYVARKVLLEEYGSKGGENIIPTLYKEKKLYLSARSSLWGNEIWLEKEHLRKKMNTLMGDEGIIEIKIDRG